jgi:hypothetical protein
MNMHKLFWLMVSLLLALAGCGADFFPDGSRPNAFSFTPQTNVAPKTQVTSAPVTITGNTAPADVSIVNGEYAIGSSTTYTTAPGKIASGQTITVRHTSASTPSSKTTTTVTIGGVSADFVSTTEALNPNPPTAVTGDPTGTVVLDNSSSPFSEAFRDTTTVTESILVGLVNNSTTTNYTVRVGFVALDSGNFIVYTGFVEGAYNAGDSNALSTNATFDLATYNRITSWEIVSITITPA